MVQLSSLKTNPSLTGAGIAAFAAVAHAIYAKKCAVNPPRASTSFDITNALASLSVMLGMVSKTSSLSWGVRAVSVLSSGIATMIPTIWERAKQQGKTEALTSTVIPQSVS